MPAAEPAAGLIVDLVQDDPGLLKSLQSLQSPCEGVAVLSSVLKKLNPPPADTQAWLREQLKASNADSKTTETTQRLLSTVLPNSEQRMGSVLTRDEEVQLRGMSNLPLRFWAWTPSRPSPSIDNPGQKTSSPAPAPTSQSPTPKQQLEPAKIWKPTESLDLSAVGLREASSDADLQGFRPIKGRGPVAANLATLRMVARAYGTPCPVDVLEKTLEGAVERAGSVPIQGMGQLAESMGLQTQVGAVKFDQLHRLELPVMVQRKHHYALITEVGQGRVLLADPEQGWLTLPMAEARESWGEQVQVVLLKRLDDTPKKTFGWGWFAPVIKRFQWPLVQVLLASLFIQLFQLANPLLIQQIIDKVINQSNLSALQVLGLPWWHQRCSKACSRRCAPGC